MKASDYIVEFLIKKHITDVFGYPGGMVTHLMDSLDKYSGQITAHINYHEQACAMAACGWAEITGLPGVAYATSGPGATNLLTGIACAFFESLPCIFITGQVNTYEQKGKFKVRQKGFQETDIVSMAQPVTKMAVMVQKSEDLPGLMEMAFHMAMEGRPGPVLLDIPMDIFRAEIGKKHSSEVLSAPMQEEYHRAEVIAREILYQLHQARCPVILAGHGISLSGTREAFRKLIEHIKIPVVTSMIAVDAISSDSPYRFGMIGAYGVRWANYLLSHSDCILSLGSRLDCRQTGVNTELFAPKAKILRVDVDPGELENTINDTEKQYCISLQHLVPYLLHEALQLPWDFSNWLNCCTHVRKRLEQIEQIEPGNRFAERLGEILPANVTVTTDVGQNQVWIAQSLFIKQTQRVLFSGGHGAMGYSLPAAIGASIATKRPVIAVTGDGGLQMNLQELQCIVREKLPIKVVLMNNRSLGMIHHFQEIYFKSNYAQTDCQKGYTVPDFLKIAQAYGIRAVRYSEKIDIEQLVSDNDPALIEVHLPQNTRTFPKLGINRPIHEQEPLLDEMVKTELEGIFNNMNIYPPPPPPPDAY